MIMKRNMNDDIDKKITQFFMDETENVSIPQDSFYKIKSGILKEKERGFLNMKFGFLKAKTVLAAGLICIATIGTVGVGASSGLSWIGSSDTRTEITEFPKENSMLSHFLMGLSLNHLIHQHRSWKMIIKTLLQRQKVLTLVIREMAQLKSRI